MNSFEAILEQRKDEISPRMGKILYGLYGDWLWLDDRIEAVSSERKGNSLARVTFLLKAGCQLSLHHESENMFFAKSIPIMKTCFMNISSSAW